MKVIAAILCNINVISLAEMEETKPRDVCIAM